MGLAACYWPEPMLVHWGHKMERLPRETHQWRSSAWIDVVYVNWVGRVAQSVKRGQELLVFFCSKGINWKVGWLLMNSLLKMSEFARGPPIELRQVLNKLFVLWFSTALPGFLETYQKHPRAQHLLGLHEPTRNPLLDGVSERFRGSITGAVWEL